jgi:integrase
MEMNIAHYVDEKKLKKVLAKMNHVNALAIETALETGLRISDVLKIESYALWFGKGHLTLKENKTGKERVLKLSESLRLRLLNVCGENYVFPHRTKKDRHRTRQAVWYDLKQACKKANIDPNGISPHSMRKIFAVRAFKRSQSVKTVQALLNHASSSTTTIYAYSDRLAPVGVGSSDSSSSPSQMA